MLTQNEIQAVLSLGKPFSSTEYKFMRSLNQTTSLNGALV